MLETWLPVANTLLIVVGGLFLALGWLFIRRRHIQARRRSMITATVFAGEGWVRGVYLVILGSHTILAAALGPMVLVTLRRALRKDYLRHRQLARVTAPTWAYVAVTGWIVYLMLHHVPT